MGSVLGKRMSLLLSLLLLLSATMTAQVISGTISGSITDPTGAVVPGATVTATNVATNQDYNGVSGKNDGSFTISALPYGFYRVKVAATGFKNSVFDNVQVNVGQVSTVNARLDVGSSVD